FTFVHGLLCCSHATSFARLARGIQHSPPDPQGGLYDEVQNRVGDHLYGRSPDNNPHVCRQRCTQRVPLQLEHHRSIESEDRRHDWLGWSYDLYPAEREREDMAMRLSPVC